VCNEDVPVIVGAFGLGYALAGERRRGVLLIVAGSAYLVFLHVLLKPAFDDGRGILESSVAYRFTWIGQKGAREILRRVAGWGSVRIVAYLLFAGAAAALRAWRVLLALVPTLLLCVVGAGWMTRLTAPYYLVICMAVIVLACVTASKGVSARAPAPLAYLAAASAVSSLVLSPLPYGILAHGQDYGVCPTRDRIDDVTRLLPEESLVCVQNNIGAHLSQRPHVKNLDHCALNAAFVVLYLRTGGRPFNNLWPRADTHFLYGLSPQGLVALAERKADAYELVYAKGGFYVFGGRTTAPLSPELRAQLSSDEASFLEATSRQSWSSALARYL